jgi:hypothetical protein
MPLYQYDATIRDAELGIEIAADIPVLVEVHAHVINGSLEYDVYDVRCDGRSLFDGSVFTHKLGEYIREQALAELDAAGPLWGRVQKDLELSYSEERGWRRAS